MQCLNAVGGDPGFPKSFDAFEYEEIGVVLAVRKAAGLLHGQPDDGDEVVAVELPVDILETVEKGIVASDDGAFDLPMAEVLRADERQGVANQSAMDAVGVDAPVGEAPELFADGEGELPVALRQRVVADGEFLAAARHFDDVPAGIEREPFGT